MKVLHVVETFAPLGGAELYMHSQISLLENAGVENLVVYWQDHPKTFQDADYPVHFIGENGTVHLPRLQSIIEESQPTIAYLHTVRNPDVIATVCQMKPAVIYMHDFHAVCPGLAKFYRRGQDICTRPYGLGCVAMIYLRRCASARHPRSVYRIMQSPPKYLAAYKAAKSVFVASTYMKNLLIQNGLESDHITILPYFVHMPGGTEPVNEQTEAPQILFVGRLEAEKGLSYLLKALAAVPHPFRLLVAGEGSQQDAYKAQATDLGIADKVDFLGWVSSARMEQIYKQITCLVFPSIWPEPFGMVGIEAYSNSRAVIAFDVGGVSDWLTDGENGYLVPPQDVKRLTERIEKLITNPELATEMGRKGYESVNKTYRAEMHLEKLLNIFKTLQR